MAPEEATLLDWLREARRVLAFCGAGISAESGLQTFRGAGGLWEGHRVEDVATAEAFEWDPQRVWRFYAQRQAALRTVEPNPAHRFLAELETRAGDFLLVTQNVDDLHERAGSRNLVKLHGSLMEVRCTECERVTPIGEPVSLAEVEADRLPRCRCGGLLRPNVVWFGEYLNPRDLEEIDAFFRRTPSSGAGLLLLVIGTSGLVSGGYGLLSRARCHGARIVEINPEPSALSSEADLVLRAPAGELLGRAEVELFER
jgi:NAD-dependent deacetylase